METKNIELPIFGNVELDFIDITDYEYRYYEAYPGKLDLGESAVDFDVHFKELSDDYISATGRVLEKRKEINQIATAAYISDYHNGGETSSYIQNWRDDIFGQIFSAEEFASFIAKTDENAPLGERLLSLLRLVRIGIYTGGEESFIVMDYAFGDDYDKGFRDDMLVIKMNEKYEVEVIVSEG